MASFYANEGDRHILPNEYFLNQNLSYSHFESESINTNHQGLSLTLGSQDPSLVHFHSDLNQYNNLNNVQYSNPTSALSNSKYLKAAQDLLDELVSVHKVSTRVKDSDSVSRVEGVSCELQDHELQDKMTKLVSMLEEVDRRYRQYRYQMQVLSSSFDSIVGPGASSPYTSLALRTISRQFRSLRDAIKKHIFSVQKRLGGDLNVSSHGTGVLGCLRYVDHQLRQKNSVHQFGVTRQSWRPQRGLPEKAVSVLRAWLFEHFLHPYPKDSEKVILARETGLTRSQVANWFINARVRLWKPMIEEMYKEEFGSAETKLKSSDKYMTRTDQDISSVNQTEFQENFGSAHMLTRHNIVHWSGDSMFCDDKSSQKTSDEGNRGNQVILALGLRRSENDPRKIGAGGIQPSGNEYYYMDTLSNKQNRFDSTNLLSDFIV